MNELEKLKQENAELIEEIKQLHGGRKPIELYSLFGKPISYWEKLENRYKVLDEIIDLNNAKIGQLEKELQNFKDMAEKGLDEFKDVGGCWGCGIQLSLDQAYKENERLKDNLSDAEAIIIVYNTCLQKIKEIAEDAYRHYEDYYDDDFADIYSLIIQKISEVISG